MISFITIILFFVYIWGLGYTATHALSKPESALERFFFRCGIGLAILPILVVLMNTLRVPLDWKIVLLLSVAFPIYNLVQRVRKKEIVFAMPALAIRKSDMFFLGVILIALVSLYVYASGAFAYPYLENEDPWGHSVGIKYVAVEKDGYEPPVNVNVRQRKIDHVLSYIDPYPPAYDIILGILHQTSQDIQWTMKFFNALIISLGFIFFYMFAEIFTKSRMKALGATFILAALPSYLSHFIWAHALGMTIFFPALIAFERGREDRRWLVVAGLIVASLWVTQNIEQPLKASTLIFIYLAVSSIIYRKAEWYCFAALFGGFLFSFVWWGAMILKYGLKGFLGYFGVESGAEVAEVAATEAAAKSSNFIASFYKALTNPGGTASRAYGFDDFFFAQHNNMINAPIGIGIVVSLLVLIGAVYLLVRYRKQIVTPDNTWRAVALFWLIYLFWGVNGQTFHFSVARGPFRIWMFLAIPVALIAVEGMEFFTRLPKLIPFQKYAIVAVLLVGVLLTSAHQKYSANTAQWPTSGAFAHPQEPFAFGEWYRSLEPNTKVFLYSPRDKLTIGYGAWSCEWCDDINLFRKEITNKSASEVHAFLKQNEYDYFVIAPYMDFKHFDDRLNETQLLGKYNEFAGSGLFTPVHQHELIIAFAVN